MSNSTEMILCWVFVGVLWILARHIGYREGFKDGYEQGEKDFKKPWERVDDEFLGQYRCSECDYYSVDEFDFCPNCGAKMKGAEDDSDNI